MSVDPSLLHQLHDAERRYYVALQQYTAALQRGQPLNTISAIASDLKDSLLDLGSIQESLLSDSSKDTSHPNPAGIDENTPLIH